MIPILPVAACAFAAPFLLGAAGASIFGRTIAGATPGLLFHSLDLEGGLSLSALSTVRFRKILEHLAAKGFTSFTLDQMDTPPGKCQEPRPKKCPLHLTFDDGCRSFMTRALPLLDHFNFKAVMFPVAGYLGKASSWDVLPRFAHLSRQEIREISDLGHEIGSHGLTHSNLTYLNTADLITELSDSKKILEDITGKPVTSLSFPFGSWNNHVWDVAQETGYLRGTIYRQHRHARPGLVPVFGVYRFDSPESILARISPASAYSFSVACARIMSHFAKGAPIWKFEKTYSLFPK